VSGWGEGKGVWLRFRGMRARGVVSWDRPISPLQGFLDCVGLVPQGGALGYFIVPFQGEKKSPPDVARACRLSACDAQAVPWRIMGKMAMPQSEQ